MASEAERASRPNSLLLETPPPEREPLRFDVQLVGAPPEVEQLVNNIKQVAEDFLYHWKTFPIVLPSSRFTGPGNRPSDIIIAPPCDELDAAALDAGVEPHPLSPKQLHAIREKGEFEVPSRHFPGQTHVWRVAGWLQRGHARAREELYGHVARACCLIVLVARDRLLRDEPLSLRRGGDAALKGLRRLMDLIFGMPSLEAKDLEKKIREERSRYLVAELICMPEHQEDIAALAAWVTRAMRRAASEKTDVREPPRVAPRVPCIYTTPQRTQVDLRLYRRELVRRAAGPLQALLEREARGWFLHFRERRAASLASQKVPPRDIEQEVRAAAMREYVSRVCAAVAASEQLRALGPGVPELLADQLRAHAIISRAEEGVRNKIEAGLATASARLVAAHPLLAAAGAWRRERLAAAAARLEAGLRWAALEAAAQDMLQHKLPQHRYFLLRDLAFLRDREPLLMKELRAAKTPTREFSWETRIWRPHNWVIVRHFRGRSERIPTVLSTRATSIVTPRSDPSQPVFLVDKEIVRRTSTRWPGWRLVNLAHRCWSWSWNMMFLLGVVVVWCSPLSLRTLLRVRALVPELELSQVNGTLFPKRSSETQTMWSRLLKLWRHVSKERTRFETEPDTGLLGKGLSRQANRIWNYGVVGGLGSLCLLLLFPIVALVTCALSLAAAAAVPLWMPALTLAVYAGNALVYDLDCPDPPRLNRWFVLFEVLVWQIAVLGILQPIAALFVAIVVCPVCALLLLVGGVSWWGLRALWEALAWRALIRRMARVPAHDSAFCRRVDGPGLRSRTHYQLTCAQAVAAVAARGEAQALAEWAAARERAVARPLHDYQHFVQACFGPFSVQIAQNAGGVYAQLEKECNELTASLREKVEARRQELALGLSDAARARVRMSAHDLRRAVQAAALELARLWGSEARGDDWWSTRGLEPGDWHALAANTLGEVFDPEILVALGDNEARLPLESGEGARAWAARCGRDEAPPDVLAERDDWRRAHGIWGEWGGAPPLRVPPPQLELGAFSPRPPPHPPLPAPPTVALVLHNRYTRGQWGGAPPLRVPPPQLELGAFSPRPPPHPPLPAPPTVALVLHNRYTRGQWGGAPPLRVPPPQLELGAFSPRPPPHPPLPAPPTVALVLHNRYTRGQWGGAPPLRVPPPQLELGAFSPRPPPHPPLPAPPTVALVLHNRYTRGQWGGAPPLRVPPPQLELGAFSPRPPPHPPLPAPPTVALVLHNRYTRGQWGGAPPLRVPPPQLELGAFSPRPPPHPPLPAPPTVALVLHNRYTRGQWGGAPPLRVPPPQLELGAFSPRPPPHPPLPAPPTVALVLHNRYTRGQWGGAPPLRVPPPQLELGAFSPRPPPHPPLPAPPTVALVLHNRYTRGQWGGAPPLRVPPPQLELGAFSPRPPPHPPLPAPPTVALVLHNRYTRGQWGGAPPLRVPPPQLELGAFSPRPPPHPPLPAPPTVALVLHNRYTRGQWGGAPPLRVPPPQLELGAFSPRPPPHPPLPAPPTVALVLHNRYTRGQWGGAPPLRVPPPQLELGAFSPRPPPHPPLPAPPTVALVLHNRYTRGQWGGAPPLRVPPPQLELGAFSPRAPPHPPLPAPPTVALVLHNRESDNPVPLDSELCAEILRSLEDAPDCDDRRDGVERYRGGGSEEGTSDGNSEGTLDDDASSQHTREAEGALCRVMPSTERAACRWTLTGRGVRLRADLASPEDVTLDTDRSHGTSV